MGLIMIALVAGSMISGWFGYWNWLPVPMLIMGLRGFWLNEQMRATLKRNGSAENPPGFTGATANFLFVTFAQHLLFFAIGAGASWLLHR